MKGRKKFIVIAFTICIFCFSYLAFRVVRVNALMSKNANKLEQETFLDKYDLSLLDIDDLDKTLDDIASEVLDIDITLVINGDNKVVKLIDMGLELNKESIKNEIVNYENSIDYYDRYFRASNNIYNTKLYNLEYSLNEERLLEFLKSLKEEVDVTAKKGKLVMNQKTKELNYEGEVVGYSLDIDKSLEVIKENISSNGYSKRMILVGENNYVKDRYKEINTKISSFSTKFDNKVSRAYNLDTASKRIDGSIVMPGEVFSYYNKTGPYKGEGYFFYNGVKGNGVCQVATTLYNAELLAGLSTVTRYGHPDKPKYVDGGLDASVAQFETSISDFRFKNTTNYPIYISSYIIEDELFVEIWSNEKATNGVTYKLRSVKKAYASYDAYRDSYKDGKLIKSEYLGHTWYYTEVE